MRRFAAAALVIACQASSQPPPIHDSDASTTPPLTGPSGCRFDAHTFSLPSVAAVGATPFPTLEGSVSCSTSSRSFDYRLVDVNGDGLPDLLVTSACDDPNVGVTGWRVYPNDGTGFGAPTSWTLPVLSTTPGCVQSALADVDGDRRPELVVTSLCTDASVGTTRWLVYHNTGTDFAASATAFALPVNAAAGSFPSLEVDSASCNQSHPAYGFFDATADGVADLVVTSACDDVNVGVGYWRVYPGSAAGVGAAVSLPLPGGAVFASPRGAAMSCSSVGFSTPAYTVLDFDGDFVPDLVVTESCSDAGAGTTHWSVFHDDGTAFATSPTLVALPTLPAEPTGAFTALDATTTCATSSASFAHALVDVDGDYKPDVVVTQSCGDATVGVGKWFVFPNDGASFGALQTWALPTDLGLTASSPASSLGAALACNGTVGTDAFQAAYLIGAPLDLVATEGCSDATLGVSHWLAFAATCK